MANQVDFDYSSGRTCYILVWSRTSLIWNTSSLAFEAYSAGSYANYVVAATEMGGSGHYAATFPSQILAGVYGISARQQVSGSAAQTDPTVAAGDFQWNGFNEFPLSDLATSGQLGTFFPAKMARSWMVQNFPIYLKSATDHITPLTSGLVSGQISQDGGIFGPLQSGAFQEVGLGFYVLAALTSGDLDANTVSLLFTGQQMSGGPSDPLPLSFILQRVSGSV